MKEEPERNNVETLSNPYCNDYIVQLNIAHPKA